ncbi:hypothetical protein BaRGS_00011007, partial [Batillaria attramentaria]
KHILTSQPGGELTQLMTIIKMIASAVKHIARRSPPICTFWLFILNGQSSHECKNTPDLNPAFVRCLADTRVLYVCRTSYESKRQRKSRPSRYQQTRKDRTF